MTTLDFIILLDLNHHLNSNASPEDLLHIAQYVL